MLKAFLGLIIALTVTPNYCICLIVLLMVLKHLNLQFCFLFFFFCLFCCFNFKKVSSVVKLLGVTGHKMYVNLNFDSGELEQPRVLYQSGITNAFLWLNDNLALVYPSTEVLHQAFECYFEVFFVFFFHSRHFTNFFFFFFFFYSRHFAIFFFF